MILGSSHAFEDFNTGTLWDEYGMASYILAGSVQPLWNTYYYLKEALKTQTPELIVLEGYLTTWSEDYIDDSTIIKNNYGLKWSRDKVNSMKVSAPKDKWPEFFLEYEQYHARYTELESGDKKKNRDYRLYDDWKGYCCNMATTQLESIDVREVTERVPLYGKTEKYYRAIIELAKENNIPIIVIISPYAGINIEDQQIFNTASDIAEEYDVPFINCNTLVSEINLDYSTDAGDFAHLNYKGSQKYSSYIGKYLKDNYDISDRRDNVKYESWQRSANFTRQMVEDQQLAEAIELNTISEMIQDPDYWVIISVDGNCNTSNENIRYFLEQQGIFDYEPNGIWLKENNTITWSTVSEEAERYIRTSAHDFCIRHKINESGQYSNTIIVDNNQYHKVDNGVNVLVYDTRTEKIADAFGIDMDDNYNIVR